MWFRWLGVAISLLSLRVWAEGNTVRGFGQLDSAKLRADRKVGHFLPSDESLQNLRVVFIDPSFEGFVPGSGQLPDSAILLDETDRFPAEFIATLSATEQERFQHGPRDITDFSGHGLDLAKAHHAEMGKSPKGPQYVLVVARNPIELDRALAFADWWDADQVVYAQNIPQYGGRSGQGPQYAYVERYLSKPSRFLINSAGNYGRMSHTAKIRVGEDGRVKLAHGKTSARLRARMDGEVEIMVAWDAAKTGAPKDLDLYLLGEDDATVYSYERVQKLNPKKKTESITHFAKSEKEQVLPGEKRVDDGEDVTELAYESIQVPLLRNHKGKYYHIEVRAHSGTFDPNRDELWLVVTPKVYKKGMIKDEITQSEVPPVELLDWTPGKNVYFPAPHREVIAVSEVSPRTSFGATGLAPKGDVFMEESSVEFSDGTIQMGTSLASTLHAAEIGLLQCRHPGMTRSEYRNYLETLSLPNLELRRARLVNLWKDRDRWDRELRPRFDQQYPKLLSTLEAQPEAAVVAVGMDQATGLFVIALDQSPARLRSLFSGTSESAGEELDYFVAQWSENGQDYIKGFTRKATTDSNGEQEPLPWLRENANLPDYTRYVSLMRARHSTERQSTYLNQRRDFGRMWVMPSFTQAAKFFALPANP